MSSDRRPPAAQRPTDRPPTEEFPAHGSLPGEVRTVLAAGLSVVPVKSPTLPPATRTNAWILGAGDVVVVDPASPWEAPRAALREALDGARVRAVLLTHHHRDHIGDAAALARSTGAPIWAHPETAARIELPVDRLLAEGDELDLDGGAWRCLHTPGHAPGHLCLHRSPRPGATRGELVAGDMVAGEGTILVDPEDGDLQDYLDSLTRLANLGPTRLLPAHGPPLPDGAELLWHYIAHRHERSDQLRAALSHHGPARPIDLVPHIYPALPAAFHPVAARQVLSHLRWLRDRTEAATSLPSPADVAAELDATWRMPSAPGTAARASGAPDA